LVALVGWATALPFQRHFVLANLNAFGDDFAPAFDGLLNSSDLRGGGRG
jgi:hypothetical protein